MAGQPQTGGTTDARGGSGRSESAPRGAHHVRRFEPSCGPGPGRTPLPGRCAGPPLGGRHHLRADLGGIVVSGRRARCVQPPNRGMVDGPSSSHRAGAQRAEHGLGSAPTRAGHPSFRPGGAVHIARLWQTMSRNGGRSLDRVGRRLLRQRDGRKLLRHPRVRAHRPALVSHPGRSAYRYPDCNGPTPGTGWGSRTASERPVRDGCRPSPLSSRQRVFRSAAAARRAGREAARARTLPPGVRMPGDPVIARGVGRSARRGALRHAPDFAASRRFTR